MDDVYYVTSYDVNSLLIYFQENYNDNCCVEQVDTYNDYGIYKFYETSNAAGAQIENETTQKTGWEQLSFEGAVATNDTPWNITAGTFEMDEEGENILLPRHRSRIT
jgi:hypothetical protein